MLLLSPCFPAFLGVFRWPGELVACPLIAHFVSIASPRLTPPTLPCLALPSCSLWLVQVAWGTCCLSTPHLHDTFVLPSFHLHFTSFHLRSTSFHLHIAFISPLFHLNKTLSPYFISLHLITCHFTSFHLHFTSFHLLSLSFHLLALNFTSFHLHFTFITHHVFSSHLIVLQFNSPHRISPHLRSLAFLMFCAICSWPGEPVLNSVGWAGAVPHIEPALLPDPATEPITAFLLELAQTTMQQQEELDSSTGVTSVTSSSSSRRWLPCVYPVDLRMYCGVTVTAPAAAQPAEVKPTAGQGYSTPPQAPHAAAASGPSSAAAVAGTAVVFEGPSVSCCFMSGWQCSSCAAASADLAAAGLKAQLELCRITLQSALTTPATTSHYQQEQQQQQEEGEEGREGDGGQASGVAARPWLSEQQLQDLLHATRLYHLQQPALDDGGSNDGSGSSMMGQAQGSAAQLAQQLRGMQLQPPAARTPCTQPHPQQQQQQQQQQGLTDGDEMDAAQLQVSQSVLQPLRDVAALREIHLQQQQQGPALPAELFRQMVEDVVCDTFSQRQRQQQEQQQVREQLRRIMGPGVGTTPAAAAGAGIAGGAGGGGVQGVSRPVFGSPSRVHARAAAAAGGLTATPASPAAAAAAGSSSSAAGVDVGDEEAVCELSMQPDALQLLQQAAEDFLQQQLASANRLALHAGRQEVQPADLRLALASSGYGHLCAGLGVAASGGRKAQVSSKRRRLLGAPSLLL